MNCMMLFQFNTDEGHNPKLWLEILDFHLPNPACPNQIEEDFFEIISIVLSVHSSHLDLVNTEPDLNKKDKVGSGLGNELQLSQLHKVSLLQIGLSNSVQIKNTISR